VDTIQHGDITAIGYGGAMHFGGIRADVSKCLYNLRILHPDKDVIVDVNNDKLCFCQIMLHPNIMGAFSYTIANRLYLSCDLPFGMDFSPANWEPVWYLLETLVEKLFDDNSLHTRHAQYINLLKFEHSLSKPQKTPATWAFPDGFNHGVHSPNGSDAPTPHNFDVDDYMYVEVFNREHIEHAVVASIKAIFLLLGYSNLKH
jgi:hypothetical protein